MQDVDMREALFLAMEPKMDAAFTEDMRNAHEKVVRLVLPKTI